MKNISEAMKEFKLNEKGELAEEIIFFNKDGEVQDTEDVGDSPDLKEATAIADRIMKKYPKIVGYTIHDKSEKIIKKGGSKK